MIEKNVIEIGKAASFPVIFNHLNWNHSHFYKTFCLFIFRANYSNPPAHGARVVSRALNTPELKAEWFDNIKTMSSRILLMRDGLRERLEKMGTPGNSKGSDRFYFRWLESTVIFNHLNQKPSRLCDSIFTKNHKSESQNPLRILPLKGSIFKNNFKVNGITLPSRLVCSHSLVWMVINVLGWSKKDLFIWWPTVE